MPSWISLWVGRQNKGYNKWWQYSNRGWNGQKIFRFYIKYIQCIVKSIFLPSYCHQKKELIHLHHTMYICVFSTLLWVLSFFSTQIRTPLQVIPFPLSSFYSASDKVLCAKAKDFSMMLVGCLLLILFQCFNVCVYIYKYIYVWYTLLWMMYFNFLLTWITFSLLLDGHFTMNRIVKIFICLICFYIPRHLITTNVSSV